MKSTPPFRADHVGSLLRPESLKRARRQFAAGEISEDDLRRTEDDAIRTVIVAQEAAGLQSATDGELRRESWYGDFLEGLDGLELFRPPEGAAFKSGASKARGFRCAAPIGFSGHPMLGHFQYLRSQTRVMPKVSIPAPSMAFFRGLASVVDRDIYPDNEGFLHDLGEAYRLAVRAFGEAGCKYLQIDDVSFAYVCDPNFQRTIAAQGDDPAKMPALYARLLNAAVASKPRDMVVAIHTCHGNRQSSWMTEGGYEPIAELLFNEVQADAYFIEYDDARSGGFEPLRFVPKGKTVVLGLVTSKFGTLESKDALKRRIEQAAKYIALDRLCLSPQCGFASTEEGNLLAEDEQWAKLALVVETAREVWA